MRDRKGAEAVLHRELTEALEPLDGVLAKYRGLIGAGKPARHNGKGRSRCR